MKDNNSQLNKFKPSSPYFEFQQFPFYWLIRTGAAYSLRMEKSLRKNNLNSTAWRILLILREMGNLSVTELAAHAVAKTPTITRATYKMKTEGFLDIYTSPHDGRVSIVEITPKGRESIDMVIENSQKLFVNIYEDFTAEQIELLNQTLKKLFVNLQEA